MSKAYQCERCKTFFAGGAAATIAVRSRDEQGETKFYKEVCEACAGLVKDFTEDVGFDANSVALRALANMGIDTECGPCMALAFTGLGVHAGPHTCVHHKNDTPILFDEGSGLVPVPKEAG